MGTHGNLGITVQTIASECQHYLTFLKAVFLIFGATIGIIVALALLFTFESCEESADPTFSSKSPVPTPTRIKVATIPPPPLTLNITIADAKARFTDLEWRPEKTDTDTDSSSTYGQDRYGHFIGIVRKTGSRVPHEVVYQIPDLRRASGYGYTVDVLDIAAKDCERCRNWVDDNKTLLRSGNEEVTGRFPGRRIVLSGDGSWFQIRITALR